MEGGVSSSIKVHKSVTPQLTSILLHTNSVWLIGLHRTSSILSCVQRKDTAKDDEELAFIQTHIPTGLEVLGIGLVVADNEEFNTKKASDTLSSIKKTFPFANLVSTFIIKSQQLKFYGKEKLEPISYEIGGDEFLSGVSVWHCEAKIPITACYQEGYYSSALLTCTGFFKEGLFQTIESVTHDLKSDSTSFLVNNSTIFSRKQGEQRLSDNKNKTQNDKEPITCTLLQSRSTSIKASPYIYYAAAQSHKATKLQLNLSVVVYAYIEETLSQIAEKLVMSLSSQAHSISNILINTKEYLKIQVTPCHYLNSFVANYITALYPIRSTEPNEDYLRMTVVYALTDCLVPYRQEIHNRFGLPNDRPLVRVSNSVPFTAEETSSKSMDVHKTINLTSQVSGGTQYLVEGCYEYYHYSQDNFNDNGWGCAYRSMQTLCSWFKLQQYIQQPVPNHQEIQSTLVKIGDKPKTFIGSSNWIGAIEISLCLQHLYGLTCNIMHIGTGGEIVSKARELAVHFQTNGTPVMIGGGVLAYTLLGIDWNEKTGDIRFLILDPHYVGNDDLKTIKEKGWCGWKTSELFRKDSFYNLCLPQRPKQI